MPSAEFQNIDFGFKYGTQKAVKQSPVENGNFKIATDTGELFVDVANIRIAVKDIYVYEHEAEIRALTDPDVNRMYYARDTYKLMAYDINNLKWVNAGGSPDEINDRIDALTDRVDAITSFEIIMLEPGDDLPPEGQPGYIYFVPQDNSDADTVYDEFIWISSLGYYEKIGITAPELEDYYKKTEVDELVSGAKDYTDTQKGLVDEDITEINGDLLNLQGYISTINGDLEDLRQAILDTETGSASSGDVQQLRLTISNNKTASEQADTALGERIDTLDLNKAPKNHATSVTDFGIASTALYGHVKLSDSYANEIGNATSGIGASQKALFDAFTILENNKTPISHSSASTDYGIGNSSYFGHVKLSDSHNTLVGEASNGIGASQKAVNDLYEYLTTELLPHVSLSGSIVIVDYGDEDEGVVPVVPDPEPDPGNEEPDPEEPGGVDPVTPDPEEPETPTEPEEPEEPEENQGE